MKIDIFCHIAPAKFTEAVERLAARGIFVTEQEAEPATVLESRFRVMDTYDEYMQVLTLGGFTGVAYGDKAVELAKIANDELAELVLRYPDRFVAGVATLPLEDMDAALVEVDRAINELHLRGVEVWAHRDKIPLDSPHYMPLYEKMSQYDLPIWIHPMRRPTAADYSSEEQSKYGIWSLFGWPYDTTVAMTRLVFSGVLEKYPNLKFITHHCGGMVPYFASRIVSRWRGVKESYRGILTKDSIEYFRMFYNDTALEGGSAALKCAYDFFGAEHLLFGTDIPRGPWVKSVVQAIEQMAIPDSDKKKIFEDNARKLMRLPV